MRLHTSLVTALMFIAAPGIPGISGALSTAMAADAPPSHADTQASAKNNAQTADLQALDGEWVYVEDRTEGRALEQLGPPMSSTFSLRTEEDAVILVRGHGSGHRDVRVTLDGSITEVEGKDKVTQYTGAWKDGAFTYETVSLRASDNARSGLAIRREFRPTPEGLLVRVVLGDPPRMDSIALYQHPQDIAMPKPLDVPGGVDDMAWLTGAWVGTRGRSSIEERWSPPAGGALLGISRTISGDRMRAFEYLRIIERDGGLVYIAQPNGGSPTEFVLTEITDQPGPRRAAFDNPRNDYPKRIVYELSAEGDLTATIGFIKGGTPRRFEFTREGESPVHD